MVELLRQYKTFPMAFFDSVRWMTFECENEGFIAIPLKGSHVFKCGSTVIFIHDLKVRKELQVAIE